MSSRIKNTRQASFLIIYTLTVKSAPESQRYARWKYCRRGPNEQRLMSPYTWIHRFTADDPFVYCFQPWMSWYYDANRIIKRKMSKFTQVEWIFSGDIRNALSSFIYKSRWIFDNTPFVWCFPSEVSKLKKYLKTEVEVFGCRFLLR